MYFRKSHVWMATGTGASAHGCCNCLTDVMPIQHHHHHRRGSGVPYLVCSFCLTAKTSLKNNELGGWFFLRLFVHAFLKQGYEISPAFHL